MIKYVKNEGYEIPDFGVYDEAFLEIDQDGNRFIRYYVENNAPVRTLSLDDALDEEGKRIPPTEGKPHKIKVSKTLIKKGWFTILGEIEGQKRVRLTGLAQEV